MTDRSQSFPDTFGRTLVAGAFLFACFALGAIVYDGACNEAHARDEVPPPITDVPRFPERPRVVAPSFPGIREAAPADGGMCIAPIPEKWDGPAPTYFAVLTMDAATPEESAAVSLAIDKCSRNVRRVADPFAVLALLRLERDLGARPCSWPRDGVGKPPCERSRARATRVDRSGCSKCNATSGAAVTCLRPIRLLSI